MFHKCDVCGDTFETNNRCSKICDKCIERIYSRITSNQKGCPVCGKMAERKLYCCDEHRKIGSRVNGIVKQREFTKNLHYGDIESYSKRKKPPKELLFKINEEARKQKMTYGQYMSYKRNRNNL